MGLMYIFPVDLADRERTEVIKDPKTNAKMVILKTYGLPFIFWGYLGASCAVIATMWLASRSAIIKLIAYDDPALRSLGYLVEYTLILTPVILIGLFFYEKHIKKSGQSLTLIYKVFFIPFFFKKIELDSPDAVAVEHFMDSPNMAKIYNQTELKGFENKGYFELRAHSEGKKILIDRHSRKADLIKIKEILDQF